MGKAPLAAVPVQRAVKTLFENTLTTAGTTTATLTWTGRTGAAAEVQQRPRLDRLVDRHDHAAPVGIVQERVGLLHVGLAGHAVPVAALAGKRLVREPAIAERIRRRPVAGREVALIGHVGDPAADADIRGGGILRPAQQDGPGLVAEANASRIGLCRVEGRAVGKNPLDDPLAGRHHRVRDRVGLQAELAVVEDDDVADVQVAVGDGPLAGEHPGIGPVERQRRVGPGRRLVERQHGRGRIAAGVGRDGLAGLGRRDGRGDLALVHEHRVIDRGERLDDHREDIAGGIGEGPEVGQSLQAVGAGETAAGIGPQAADAVAEADIGAGRGDAGGGVGEVDARLARVHGGPPERVEHDRQAHARAIAVGGDRVELAVAAIAAINRRGDPGRANRVLDPRVKGIPARAIERVQAEQIVRVDVRDGRVDQQAGPHALLPFPDALQAHRKETGQRHQTDGHDQDRDQDLGQRDARPAAGKSRFHGVVLTPCSEFR